MNGLQQIPGVTLLGVRPDTTRTGKTVFKVQTSDGQERSTFDAQAANKAAQFVNQTGTLVISFSRDGKYQNFEDFLPGGNGGFAAPQAPAFQAPAPQAPVAQFQAVGTGLDKEKRIIRGNALNAAAATLGPFISTGFFVDDDGRFLTEDVAAVVTKLAALYVRYLDPEAAPAAPQPAAPMLPPGVSPEQALALLQAAGVPVTTGASVAEAQDAAAEAPQEEVSGKLY